MAFGFSKPRRFVNLLFFAAASIGLYRGSTATYDFFAKEDDASANPSLSQDPSPSRTLIKETGTKAWNATTSTAVGAAKTATKTVVHGAVAGGKAVAGKAKEAAAIIPAEVKDSDIPPVTPEELAKRYIDEYGQDLSNAQKRRLRRNIIAFEKLEIGPDDALACYGDQMDSSYLDYVKTKQIPAMKAAGVPNETAAIRIVQDWQSANGGGSALQGSIEASMRFNAWTKKTGHGADSLTTKYALNAGGLKGILSKEHEDGIRNSKWDETKSNATDFGNRTIPDFMKW